MSDEQKARVSAALSVLNDALKESGVAYGGASAEVVYNGAGGVAVRLTIKEIM